MKEKRYAILSSDYPSMNYPNVMGFVHSRAKAYKKLGINIEVFCISKSTERYEYEGILVNRDNKDNLRQKLVNNKYDAILIHFLDQDKADIVGDQECYIWVHGFEALSWKRRLFNLNPRLPLYIYENTKQLRNFKNFAKNNKNAKFIFVSEWMRNVTCADINYEIKNYIIIPNFIDEDTFSYHEKNPELRKKFY